MKGVVIPILLSQVYSERHDFTKITTPVLDETSIWEEL